MSQICDTEEKFDGLKSDIMKDCVQKAEYAKEIQRLDKDVKRLKDLDKDLKQLENDSKKNNVSEFKTQLENVTTNIANVNIKCLEASGQSHDQKLL